MEITDALREAMLVACDQSYNPAWTTGSTDLGPTLDAYAQQNNGTAYAFPESMPTWWINNDGLSAWRECYFVADSGSGFGAIVYRKESSTPGKFDYIVALRGTRGPDPQDWNDNLSYGWDHWISQDGGQALMAELQTLIPTTDQISFTGQSLGGALAQYAAYQYVAESKNPDGTQSVDPSNISLVTFNGLGATDALSDPNHANTIPGLENGYDPNMLNGVSTEYYWITNDLVNELGGGNLNDPNGANDYRLDFTDASTGYARNIVQAHRISEGFYYGFNTYGGTFSTDRIHDPIHRLNIEGTAAVGTAISNLLNDGYTSEAEATARLLAALIIGTAFGPQEDIDQLADDIAQKCVASGSNPELVDRIKEIAEVAAKPAAQAGKDPTSYRSAAVLRVQLSSGDVPTSCQGCREIYPRARQAIAASHLDSSKHAMAIRIEGRSDE